MIRHSQIAPRIAPRRCPRIAEHFGIDRVASGHVHVNRRPGRLAVGADKAAADLGFNLVERVEQGFGDASDSVQLRRCVGHDVSAFLLDSRRDLVVDGDRVSLCRLAVRRLMKMTPPGSRLPRPS